MEKIVVSMAVNQKELSGMIKDCHRPECPLYDMLDQRANSQGRFRTDQLRWTQRYHPRPLTIGKSQFGARLLLVMESPPPDFEEYFYEESQGLDKTLFVSIVQALAQAEIALKGDVAAEEIRVLVSIHNKQKYLEWIAGLGLIVVDAAKCRKVLRDAADRKIEASDADLKSAFSACSEILTQHISHVNPFRIAVGIASVYKSGEVHRCVKKLAMQDRFHDKQINSPFRGNKKRFIKEIKDVWMETQRLIALRQST